MPYLLQIFQKGINITDRVETSCTRHTDFIFFYSPLLESTENLSMLGLFFGNGTTRDPVSKAINTNNFFILPFFSTFYTLSHPSKCISTQVLEILLYFIFFNEYVLLSIPHSYHPNLNFTIFCLDHGISHLKISPFF